jgi:3-deoxy-7-phosphoheptulonate synthase
MASGLSMPVGMKNGTDGNVKVAIDALEASRTPHNFLGMDPNGRVSTFSTTGNPFGHIILRGGGGKTNYDAHTVQMVEAQLAERGLPKRVVIDCSHGNSKKDHTKQATVFNDIIDQINAGNTSIIGAMLESNLYEGNQPISADVSGLKYGISITDKCMGWEDTEQLIMEAYNRLKVPVAV